MYQASVPAFVHALNALSKILDKGAAYAKEKGSDPAELINARLAPDMFPLSRQVQIAADNAKGATARLAGREIPKFEDTESTFAELKARIAKTLDFIQSVKASEIDGSEERQVVLRAGGEERTFTGQNYLAFYALPNFYFHVTTAYDILRHKGVPLGKPDYIGVYKTISSQS
jgi:hypothetical protein